MGADDDGPANPITKGAESMRYAGSVALGAWLGSAINGFSFITVVFALGTTLPFIAIAIFNNRPQKEPKV